MLQLYHLEQQEILVNLNLKTVSNVAWPNSAEKKISGTNQCACKVSMLAPSAEFAFLLLKWAEIQLY